MTTSGRALPINSAEIVQLHLEKMSVLSRNFRKSSILHMDETNIQLDYPCELQLSFCILCFLVSFIFFLIIAAYTYEQSGSQTVKSTIAGGERVKISLAFTASSDGLKLPILCILPRKKPLKFVCPSNVVIMYKAKSKTFDTQVMKSCFINNIIRPYMLRHN